MRRMVSFFAAMALTVLLVGSASAAPRSTFYGSFDALVEGDVVGHITAAFWSTDLTSPAGVYSFRNPDGRYSTAQIGEASFYADTSKEVWFQAMEIGYVGGTHNAYGVFVGHFVDAPSPHSDYVEFWTRSITGEGADNFILQPTQYFRFDVGSGTFSLRVAP